MLCVGRHTREERHFRPMYESFCSNIVSGIQSLYNLLRICYQSYFKLQGKSPFIPMPIFSHAAAISSNLGGILKHALE